MKVAITGCGLIGRKRAQALSRDDELVACCDIDESIARRFSAEFKCPHFTNHVELLHACECDAVVVAVVNKYIREIVTRSIETGAHVLSEKPLGRNAAEALEMVTCAKENHKVLKTGFNHRFHPAIRQAKELADAGSIGELMTIRARYGHGGRPGMEKEWRSSKELCGGGELLDQGVHIIDLIGWYGGDIVDVYGRSETKFWDMQVEDNAFAILKTARDVTASFHVSWTNWKNIFSFEIFGTGGYLRIEGLGGSYGPETLEFGRRRQEGGRADIEIFEYPAEDVSWQHEWREFCSAISDKREPIGSGLDGLKANRVIEAVYRSSRESKPVKPAY